MNKNITLKCLYCLCAVILLSGCRNSKRNDAIAVSPAKQNSLNTQPRVNQQTNAVASAMELSKKYAELSEQYNQLRQERDKLQQSNEQLKAELVPCKTQLTQAQKELKEANELLVDMRVELNNWKDNILGFRQEMRQADIAQLEALAKIMEILGADSNSVSEE